MTASAPRLAACAATLAVAAACGKMGPPLPPLRPVPVPISDLAVERVEGRVTLRFTVPNATVEATTPPRIDAVEVFGLSQPEAAPPPSATELAVPAYRIATVAVKRPNDKPVAKDTRPGPGDTTTFVETLSVPAGATGTVRYYAVTGVSGSRRGRVPTVLAVSLSRSLQAPTDVKTDVTEQALRLTWTAGTAKDERYVVEEPARGGEPPVRLTADPLTGAEFSLPVEFGKERCFAVRAVAVTGRATVIGPAAAPVCVTPVDQFPPAPPTALTPFASEGAVELTWTASSSADVAGYVVLRGEGASDTLQRLTATPITGTQYKDQAVKAGMTYTYAVIAVDKQANQSKPSERQSVTARDPTTTPGVVLTKLGERLPESF